MLIEEILELHYTKFRNKDPSQNSFIIKGTSNHNFREIVWKELSGRLRGKLIREEKRICVGGCNERLEYATMNE